MSASAKIHLNTSAEYHYFSDDGIVPNSRLPVLIYRRAFDLNKLHVKERLRKVIEENGWTIRLVGDSVVSTHLHYHSWAHEVLVALKGHATLQIGGKKGRDIELNAGDAMAIPAGVAHKRLDKAENFTVASLFLKGVHWNVCTDLPEPYKRAKKEIPRAKMPIADPIYGVDGPLMKYWAGLSRSVSA